MDACRVGAEPAPWSLAETLLAEGSSYGKLLQQTRLEIAQQHLLNSRLNITELALRLGYAEVAVFSRNFRHWTGLSPLQWRRQQRTLDSR